MFLLRPPYSVGHQHVVSIQTSVNIVASEQALGLAIMKVRKGEESPARTALNCKSVRPHFDAKY